MCSTSHMSNRICVGLLRNPVLQEAMGRNSKIVIESQDADIV